MECNDDPRIPPPLYTKRHIRIPEIEVYPVSDTVGYPFRFQLSFEQSLHANAAFTTSSCTIIPEDQHVSAEPNYISDDDPHDSSQQQMIVRNDSSYAQWVPGQKLCYYKDGHSDEFVLNRTILSDDNCASGTVFV